MNRSTLSELRMYTTAAHPTTVSGGTVRIAIGFAMSVLAITGCDSSGGTNEGAQPFDVEPFVYEALGSGTIIYEHYSSTGTFHYVRVIDADQQKAWQIPLDGNVPIGSPDGKHIAFIGQNETLSIVNLRDVYMWDAEGSSIARLTDLDGAEQYLGWLPGGDEIIYLETGESPAIYIQPLTLNTGSVQPAFTFHFVCAINNEPFSISSSGRVIFSSTICYLDGTQNAPVRGIISVSLDTGAVSLIRVNPENGLLYAPTWDPSGQQIAFLESTVVSQSEERYQLQLKLMDPNGENESTLATLEAESFNSWCCGNDNSIAWAPDGSKIVFNNHEGSTTSYLYVVNRDGTGLTQITTDTGTTNRSVSWGR